MKDTPGKGKRLGEGRLQRSEKGPKAKWGWRKRKSAGGVEDEDAYLSDSPAMYWNPGQIVSMLFETTALVVEGPMSGTYLGSVHWGFKTNTVGKVDLEDFKVVSLGTPSRDFVAAAQNWNAQEIRNDDEYKLNTPVGGKVLSTGAIKVGRRYPRRTLMATIQTSDGARHEVRNTLPIIVEEIHVSAGDEVDANEFIIGKHDVGGTIDLPTTSHDTADAYSLDDRQFEERMRLVATGLNAKTRGTAVDQKNARFEFRALCRETIRRGGSARDSGFTEVVGGGETLWEAALRTLGDGDLWPRLFALNADALQDPQALLRGGRLRMPQPFAPKAR